MTVVFGNGNKTGEIVALVFTLLATIIASVQKIGDFENQAQGNAKVADLYLNISKKINNISKVTVIIITIMIVILGISVQLGVISLAVIPLIIFFSVTFRYWRLYK